jgi:hypothetical protein
MSLTQTPPAPPLSSRYSRRRSTLKLSGADLSASCPGNILGRDAESRSGVGSRSAATHCACGYTQATTRSLASGCIAVRPCEASTRPTRVCAGGAPATHRRDGRTAHQTLHGGGRIRADQLASNDRTGNSTARSCPPSAMWNTGLARHDDGHSPHGGLRAAVARRRSRRGRARSGADPG